MNSSSVSTTTWRNLFVVVDDGTGTLKDYDEPGQHLARHALLYPKSVGILIVIPVGARPPSDGARAAVNALLERHASSFIGLVWTVEGKGFNSAMVRATLTAMSLARRRSHATHVTGNMEEGLGWLLSRRATGARDTELAAALAAVSAARGLTTDYAVAV